MSLAVVDQAVVDAINGVAGATTNVRGIDVKDLSQRSRKHRIWLRGSSNRVSRQKCPSSLCGRLTELGELRAVLPETLQGCRDVLNSGGCSDKSVYAFRGRDARLHLSTPDRLSPSDRRHLDLSQLGQGSVNSDGIGPPR
jgi:hypothetical protein